MSFVYLLQSTDGSTYVGATIDVNITKKLPVEQEELE